MLRNATEFGSLGGSAGFQIEWTGMPREGRRYRSAVRTLESKQRLVRGVICRVVVSLASWDPRLCIVVVLCVQRTIYCVVELNYFVY